VDLWGAKNAKALKCTIVAREGIRALIGWSLDEWICREEQGNDLVLIGSLLAAVLGGCVAQAE
jgi:hypothetical protein